MNGATTAGLLEAAGIAERRSEHPWGEPSWTAPPPCRCTIPEPDEVDYTPGKGVVVGLRGEQILAGSRTLLTERGVTVAENRDGEGRAASEVLVARGGRFLGSIRISMRFGRKPPKRLPSSRRWASAPCSSPEMPRGSLRRLDVSCGVERYRGRATTAGQGRRSKKRSSRKVAASQWWAMVSMMPRP